MLLTAKEKALIKAHRKEQDRCKPTKSAFLKEDLYQFTDEIGPYPIDCHTYSKKEVNKYIQAFASGFKLCLETNSVFDCYSDNNTDHWYDRVNGSVESASSSWAHKYLQNKRIKKKNNEK
jgi:hypothetical protein